MQEILRNAELRRMFFIGTLAILVLLVVFRLCVIGDPGSDPVWNACASVTQSLFATILTTTLLGVFLFYITPRKIDPTQLQILPPRDLNAAFEEALRSATSWQFKGAFGRYLRSKVIPELSKKARAMHMDIQITGIILDLRNESLCAKHAEHRNGVVNVDRAKVWNTATVQDQLYATILVDQIAQRTTPLLDIRLYLEDNFSPSRLDRSTDLVLVTKEDRTAPAIRACRGNYFYESCGNEFAVARSQADEVSKTTIEFDSGALNSENAKDLLTNIKLWDKNLDDNRLTKICKLVNDNDNPYG